MYGHHYFGGHFFGGHFYGDGGNVVPIFTAAQIAAAVWDTVIDGYQARDLLAIIAAIAAGKTTIIALGGGFATVTFRKIDDSGTMVVADMTGSERTNMTITP